jgi:hypothetical protein
MKTNTPTVWILPLVACAFLAFNGCAPTYLDAPLERVEYDSSEKINLSVMLCFSDDVRNADFDASDRRYVIRVGSTFVQNAETLARTLFSVVEMGEQREGCLAPNVDATLTPAIVSMSRNYPVWATTPSKTVVQVRWTMVDTTGQIVWLDTISGSESKRAGNSLNYKKKAAEDFKTAIHRVLSQTFEAISSSPEILRFAEERR